MRSVEAVLPLLALVSACASDVDSPYDELGVVRYVTLTPDPDCAPWPPEFEAIADQAAALWAQWGVLVDRADIPADGSLWVRVCTSIAGAGEHQIGRASHDDEGDRIELRDESWATLAHEIGHLVLPGDGDEDHLPYGEQGIMGKQIAGCAAGRCGWSDADIDHLESFGLSR
jgi:hypothetical protein